MIASHLAFLTNDEEIILHN